MKHIIIGTNRPNSRSLDIGRALHQIHEEIGTPAEILDLRTLELNLASGESFQDDRPPAMQAAIEKIQASRGLIFVVPEYNGSFPGALKYFIDHWSFPDSFENRPVCFIGLGWQWGGLRPVEHLQGVMAYRNAYMFPKRTFIQNIGNHFDENNQLSEEMIGRLRKQMQGFDAFVKALEAAALDANSLLKVK